MTVPESNKLLQKLQKYSEKVLTERIIIPLLEKLDFDSIEHRHGPYERGVDILCIKKDEIEEAELLAIQVKKFKFSGNASETGHLHNVLNQISQCIEEPIKLKDGTERIANRVWFISPYTLHVSALEASFSKYIKANTNRIRVLDGDKLLTLLEQKAPEILAELGDKYSSYLKDVQNELTFLQEASAFRLKDKMSILPIYIHLDISVLPSRLLAILNKKIEPQTYEEFSLMETVLEWVKISERARSLTVKVNQWIDFGIKSKEVLKINPVTVIKNQAKETSSEAKQNQLKEQKIEAVVRVDWPKLYNAIIKLTKSKLDKLKKSSEQASTNLVEFHRLINQLDEVVNHPAPALRLKPISEAYDYSSQFDRISVSIEDLLKSRFSSQITGQAGAGKTTLLRLLGHKEVCNRTGRIPIFVPLTTLTPKLSLIGLVQRICKKHGLAGSKKSFDELLKSGRLLLLLDGIDEAASRVKVINAEIAQFISDHGAVQCIFTARPWAALDRSPTFITLQLLPFTKDQARKFFYKWFADEPSHAEDIITHLDANLYLYEVVSTPLVATIFAVVKLFGQGLPKSLLEVYERRFELLLHNWDAAKGVKRDTFNTADKKFFLRKLAFFMHKQTIRSMPWYAVVQLVLQTLGSIRDRDEAELFTRELVQHNNVLIQHEDGNWGLGHLQYQEYLAALEARENHRANLANFIESGWWWSVIKMYAEMTRDISTLIYNTYYQYGNKVEGLTTREDILDRLNSLLHLAPNTEEKASGLVQREVDMINAVRDSFDKYYDDEILHGKGRPS